MKSILILILLVAEALVAKSVVVNPRRQVQEQKTAKKTSPAQGPVAPIVHPFQGEEAKNLIVANQPYSIKYEDEENLGKVSEGAPNSISLEFSDSDIETYKNAVAGIISYRNLLRSRCLTESSKRLAEAVEKYLSAICAFNRKAIPLVSDITENNSSMILLVNRNTLVDAPVLITRYFQFKKQRFKESLGRFLDADAQLVNQMVTVAKTLKVNLKDEDWNRSYGIRENAIEAISQWPRETIFTATTKLVDAKETVCLSSVVTEEEKTKKLAE